ncbi:MAG: hypothetical protein U0270_20135 [Labilithrix sp.]
MRLSALGASGLALASLVLAPREALAQNAASAPSSTARAPESGRPRIVIVTNHADAAIVPLLQADLEALGLDVSRVDHGPDEVIPRDLTAAARTTGAVAGFRIIVAQGKVEVWIADRVTGKIVLREILVQEHESSASELATVVFQAVELLRVSLMELEAPHPSHGEVAPPPAIAEISGFPEAKGALAIGAGPAALLASRDLGVQPMVRFAVRWRLPLGQHAGRNEDGRHSFHVAAHGVLPLTSADVSGPEGTAEVRPMLFGASVLYAPARAVARWQPLLGMGASALVVRAQGDAAFPRSELSYTGVSPLALANAYLHVRVFDHFRLWGGVDAGASFVPAKLLFGPRVVAAFEPYLLQAGIGVEVAIP